VLKRPSARRKSPRKQIELNLVPILDTMVTLIAFLLFTMSFLSLVTIESPAPIVSADSVKEKIKELPLQLTLTLRETEVEIWSPFDRIKAQKIPNLEDGKTDTRAIHEALLNIKGQFTHEKTIIFAPDSSISYDVLIATMDAVRMIEKTDPPIYVKNPVTGVDEPLKSLFPEVIFGNILGDS
jgi:biopolymer transport protein ExbD